MIRVKSLFVATVIGLALGLAAGSYAKTQDLDAISIYNTTSLNP